MPARHRLVPASEPDAEPACRLTPEEGKRRQADTDSLFGALVEQRLTPAGQSASSAAIPTHSGLCSRPSLTKSRAAALSSPFEQIEQEDSILLRVGGKAINPA